MTTFTQLTARLINFLMDWLLVLGLEKGLVEFATVCLKSWVILISVSNIVEFPGAGFGRLRTFNYELNVAT